MKTAVRKLPGDTRAVLVVLPTWVGDFVMATPFLRTVRNRFRDASITFLAEENLRDLIEGGDWMDECVYWPVSTRPRPWHREYRGLRRTLRKRRFDLAILLPNSFRSALIAWHAGARRRIGYNRDGRGLLLTDRVPVRNRVDGKFVPMPLVAYYADLAEALGCERPDDRLELFTTPDCDVTLDQHLRSAGLSKDAPGGPLIVISPGGKYGTAKCWFPDRFAAVADRLIEEKGASVVVTCGPGEEHIAREIASAMNRSAAVFDDPRLSLGELKSLVRRSDLLLCNDAGLRHFAKAFDVPVVTIFGPTHPEWTATSYEAERIVRIDVDCGPCQQRICPQEHLKCMFGVTVDAAHDACVELLEMYAREDGS
ncbi:MAG: lipopolysaccharide heptosyltransferase II [Phycisphaerales bacterium]|nr:MAG: lipopolysaccharide heptosyltransferase II [Phycisphaerales bacterium]